MKLKRILFIAILLLMTFALTSCRVNWFDESYNVPWYVVAITTAIFCVIAFFIAGKTISNKLYVCPKCGGEFHPNFWLAMCSMHIGSDRLFRCPKCGHKGFCKVSRNNKE
jgi:DNA-directed RNA polymerase subunit RPC12/RpoP